MKNDDNRVIGVHNSGNEKIEENYATPITAELIDKIKDFKNFLIQMTKFFLVLKMLNSRKKLKNYWIQKKKKKKMKITQGLLA